MSIQKLNQNALPNYIHLTNLNKIAKKYNKTFNFLGIKNIKKGFTIIINPQLFYVRLLSNRTPILHNRGFPYFSEFLSSNKTAFSV